MTKIKTILADVGGVLIKSYDISNDIRDRLSLSEEVFRPLWNDLVHTYGSGKITEEEMWQIYAKAGGSAVDVQENVYAVPFEKHLTVYHPVLDTLRRFKKAGYNLAVLSDTNPNHADVLRRHGVYAPFDYVFLSHETGIRKPDPTVYTHALNTMSIVDPSTVLFIDDRQTNLDTAHQLGLQTLLSPDDEQAIVALLEEKVK